MYARHGEHPEGGDRNSVETREVVRPDDGECENQCRDTRRKHAHSESGYDVGCCAGDGLLSDARSWFCMGGRVVLRHQSDNHARRETDEYGPEDSDGGVRLTAGHPGIGQEVADNEVRQNGHESGRAELTHVEPRLRIAALLDSHK